MFSKTKELKNCYFILKIGLDDKKVSLKYKARIMKKKRQKKSQQYFSYYFTTQNIKR